MFTNQIDFVMIAFWFESYVNVVTDLSVWYNIGDGDESGIGLVASRSLVYCVSGNYHINVCMCSCDIVLFFILHFSNHLWYTFLNFFKILTGSEKTPLNSQEGVSPLL